MKIYYKFYMGLLFLTIWSTGFADEPLKAYWEPIAPSPQIWQFATYGNEEQNLYTGTVSAKIPIYTYKDPDFEIPISLDYSSTGYRPNRQASSSGLGWVLNTGGYITRRVIGAGDEYDQNGWYYGFYPFHIQQGGLLRDDGIFSLGDPECRETCYFDGYPRYWDSAIRCYETTPDEHMFNFLGHQGQFMMETQNKIYVYNTNHPFGEYKIDLSLYPWDDSSIKITTGDGYVYTFERKRGMEAYKFIDVQSMGQIYVNTGSPLLYWPLSKITAPNGREAIFEYGEQETIDNVQWFTEQYDDFKTNDVPFCSAIREFTCQLKKITIGSVSIDFEYQNRTPEIHKLAVKNAEIVVPKLTSAKRLAGIKVTDNSTGRVLRNCMLKHTDAPGNPVMFLKQVHIDGEGDYSMEYYDEKREFPAHGTLHLDHWGYYNKADNRDPIVYWGVDWERFVRPQIETNSLNQESIISKTREPNFSATRMGMLMRIDYPTSGYTSFYYEQNCYGAKVTRDMTHDNNPYLMTVSGDPVAGGLRIWQINDYSSASKVTTRAYRYKFNDERGNGTGSSGILMHAPRYHFEGQFRNYVNHCNAVKYPRDRYHMAYSEVIEKYQDGTTGYNVYHFTSYSDTPDICYNPKYVIDWHGNKVAGTCKLNMVAEPDSRYIDRGKLLWKRKYNDSGKLTYSEENTYFPQDAHEITTIKNSHFLNENFYISHEYTMNNLLKSTKITENTDNGEFLTDYVYHYNSYGQPFNVTQNSISTHWVYPTEQVCNPVAQTMVQKNIVSPTLYEYETDVNGNILRGTKNTYVIENGLVVLKSVGEMVQSATPIKDYQRGLYQALSTFSYDAKGRIIQKLEKNGVPTSYLWGYHGLFPVAIGVNIPYATLNAQEKDSADGTLTETAENTLRNMSDAELTTIKYIPFVGAAKVTNPRGEWTSYLYNEDGKLSEVSNSTHLKLYEYHYSTDSK